MDYPEPEPECIIFYELDPFSYFLMFFASGVGWFALGYLLTHCFYNNGRSRPEAILAERIN